MVNNNIIFKINIYNLLFFITFIVYGFYGSLSENYNLVFTSFYFFLSILYFYLSKIKTEPI